MKKIILLGLLFTSFVGYSQIPDESDSDKGTTIIEVLQSDESNQNQIYNLVELMPEYPGGIRAFYNYVSQNYRIPNELQKTGVNGTIYVNFVVEKDGSLTDIKVIRDLGYGTGAEAVRVLKRSKKWRAGIQNGRTVRVAYSLPIRLVVDAEQVETKE